jgi:hypothetical protein
MVRGALQGVVVMHVITMAWWLCMIGSIHLRDVFMAMMRMLLRCILHACADRLCCSVYYLLNTAGAAGAAAAD